MSLKDKIKAFNESETFWIGILRDFLFVISVVAVFASISQIALGLWSPMVAVESGSMIPHIRIGDIIFVENIERTEIITYEEGKQTGYISFEDYGDVILYKPCGKDGATPIIHRAVYYVEEGKTMWNGGLPAPYAGYITKGDNNKGLDQQGNICRDQPGNTSKDNPVKKEWIIGVARFYRIPALGYVSLIPRKILSI